MLNKRLGLRAACIVSACLAAGGFLIAADMGKNIAITYLSYGVMVVLGIIVCVT